MNRDTYQVLQQRFVHLRENKMFEAFVIAIILVSALVIGAKTYTISPQIDILFKVLKAVNSLRKTSI